MQECNRVIEAQLGGRSSPAAVEANDLREELLRLRGELDNVDSERKVLKAQLEDKEKVVDNLSVRLSALEKSGGAGVPTGKENGGSPRAESESKLIARINQLTQQLEVEKQKNRSLKGA
jgi:predicted nuclease with TOPRIM domain